MKSILIVIILRDGVGSSLLRLMFRLFSLCVTKHQQVIVQRRENDERRIRPSRKSRTIICVQSLARVRTKRDTADLVSFSSGKTSEQLFREMMRLRSSILRTVVCIRFLRCECCCSGCRIDA